MTWYNCVGLNDWVCMLKGVLFALILFLIGNGLDELVNRKKYKNERELKKIENKKIKELVEEKESHSLGEDKIEIEGRINPDVKRN